jgi:hypothetical protein
MTTRPRPEDEYRRLRREEEDLLEEHFGHRAGVYRRAIIFTPLSIGFLVAFALVFLSLIGGNGGAVLGSAILGVIAFAVTFEAQSALRDLRAEPITTSGPAERVWTKSRFLVFGKTGYLLLDGRVFDIRVDTSMLLEPGTPVTVRHWPHTNLIVTLHRGAEGSDARPDQGPDTE